MTKGVKLISVVVPTYNKPKMLDKCLDSLLKIEYPDDEYEVIVVDHGVFEETKKVVGKYPIRYIAEKNESLAAARNKGVEAAMGDIIAFIDDDVEVPRDWLKKIHGRFQSDPYLMCLGGSDFPVESESYFGKCVSYLGNFVREHFWLFRSSVLKITGANFVFRKEVFNQVGLFRSWRLSRDENKYTDQTRENEDFDMVDRVRKAKLKISYDNSIFVYHHASGIKKTIWKHVKNLTLAQKYLDEMKELGQLKIYYIEMVSTVPFWILLLFNVHASLLYAFACLLLLTIFSSVISIKMSGRIIFTPGILLFLVFRVVLTIVLYTYSFCERFFHKLVG